jgi:hypothetical protein
MSVTHSRYKGGGCGVIENTTPFFGNVTSGFILRLEILKDGKSQDLNSNIFTFYVSVG